MAKKVFKIVCKDVVNVYIHGKISGIIIGLTKNFERKGFANKVTENGVIFRVETTKYKYRKICKVVETLYPGLCEFED